MSDSKFQILLSKWLEDPLNEELIKDLEQKMESDPDELKAFRKITEDYKKATRTEIPENPFLV